LCKVAKHGIVFFGLQANFNICNDNDAEVSLQIANIATQALLSYRMKMMPVLVCLCLSQKCVFVTAGVTTVVVSLLLTPDHHLENCGQTAKHTQLVYGDRAFPVATARVWYSLPVSVTSAAMLNMFKQWLKTKLFIHCYDLPSSYVRKHSVQFCLYCCTTRFMLSR